MDDIVGYAGEDLKPGDTIEVIGKTVFKKHDNEKKFLVKAKIEKYTEFIMPAISKELAEKKYIAKFKAENSRSTLLTLTTEEMKEEE